MDAAEALLDDYLTDAELAEELHVSLRTIKRWRNARTGPPCIYVRKRPLTLRETARKWLRELERRPIVRGRAA